MPNSLGLTTPSTLLGITIPHINNYPEGSSASRSSIEDCHHMKCVIQPRWSSQLRCVITTCCVIQLRWSSAPRSSPSVSSSLAGHHNLLC